MFEFGRELKRAMGEQQGSPDPSLYELLDAEMLAAQGRATDVEAGRVSTKQPFPIWLRSAAVWREHARRTGDAMSVRRAASAATSAGRVASTPAEQARAAVEQALASLIGADLFGDQELYDAARNALKMATDTKGDAICELMIEHAHARLVSRDAIASGVYGRALDAAALFDSVITRLDDYAVEHRSIAMRFDATLARIERADLLQIFGARMADARLLSTVEINLTALLHQIEGDFEPLAWARVAEVLGLAQVALGELEHRNEAIALGVASLLGAAQRFAREHSPLDWARLQHGLAVGLQALGEANDDRAAFLEAEKAFDRALEVVGSGSLSMRAMAACNRAACVARRAERCGDLIALSNAESAFKAEAARADARHDPVGWAVLQINLARVYEARADLLGGFLNRDAAVYALEEAREVFCDHGLKTLADTATSGLERVRAT
jgi:hypothetical protein